MLPPSSLDPLRVRALHRKWSTTPATGGRPALKGPVGGERVHRACRLRRVGDDFETVAVLGSDTHAGAIQPGEIQRLPIDSCNEIRLHGILFLHSFVPSVGRECVAATSLILRIRNFGQRTLHDRYHRAVLPQERNHSHKPSRTEPSCHVGAIDRLSVKVQASRTATDVKRVNKICTPQYPEIIPASAEPRGYKEKAINRHALLTLP